MCSDNAYIYFSDLVPSQNSYVVTEKPLACSQGQVRMQIIHCMLWFINPSEQFENTQLKKKNPVFSYCNLSKFSDGNAVWKRERTVLKASPSCEFLCRKWRVMPLLASPWWDGPLLGNPKRSTAYVKCHASEGLSTAFPERILSRSRTQPSEEVFKNTDSQFPRFRVQFSPKSPASLPLLHQACCLAWANSRACNLLHSCKTPWSMSLYRRCVPALGRVRLFQCPRTHPWAYLALLLVLKWAEMLWAYSKIFKFVALSWWVFRSFCLENWQND